MRTINCRWVSSDFCSIMRARVRMCVLTNWLLKWMCDRFFRFCLVKIIHLTTKATKTKINFDVSSLRIVDHFESIFCLWMLRFVIVFGQIFMRSYQNKSLLRRKLKFRFNEIDCSLDSFSLEWTEFHRIEANDSIFFFYRISIWWWWAINERGERKVRRTRCLWIDQ